MVSTHLLMQRKRNSRIRDNSISRARSEKYSIALETGWEVDHEMLRTRCEIKGNRIPLLRYSTSLTEQFCPNYDTFSLEKREDTSTIPLKREDTPLPSPRQNIPEITITKPEPWGQAVYQYWLTSYQPSDEERKMIQIEVDKRKNLLEDISEQRYYLYSNRKHISTLKKEKVEESSCCIM